MRRTSRAVALAALLTVPACKDAKTADRGTPVAAPAARDVAREQQGDVTRADEQAAQQRKQLLEAQQQAERERAEARQQAAAHGEQAQPVAGRETAATQTAAGRVGEVMGDGFVLERDGQPPLYLLLAPRAPIAVGGRIGRLSSLQPGMQVRVDYHLEPGGPVAERVEAPAPR